MEIFRGPNKSVYFAYYCVGQLPAFLHQIRHELCSVGLVCYFLSSVGPSPPFVTVAPPNQDVQLPSTTGPSRSFTCTGAENAFPATQSFELRLNGMSITNGFSFGMSVVSIVETTAFSGTQITAEVTINPVLLEAENNYTCVFLSPCGNTTATHSLNVSKLLVSAYRLLSNDAIILLVYTA